MKWRSRWEQFKEDALDVLAVFATLFAAAVAGLIAGVSITILISAIQGGG